MKECLHGKEVNQEYRIETPSDLVHAIKVIAGNIADGTIIEDSRKPQGQMTITTFSELVAGEIWDDFFEYYFVCPNTA